MIRPRRSTRITGLHSYHGAVRPCAPHRYSAPRSFRCSGISLHDRPRPRTAPLAVRRRGATGSHVPYRSPDQARATSMPDTAWPTSRPPPGSSRGSGSAPVSMSSSRFDTSSVVHSRSPSWSTPDALDGAPFSATLSTPALDRRTLRWFAAPPLRGRPRRITSHYGQPLHLRYSTASLDPIFYIEPPSAFVVTQPGRV